LQKLIKEEIIVKHKVTQSIKWWGHLNGMDNIKLVEEITDWNIGSKN
jgi:hypothetical protein